MGEKGQAVGGAAQHAVQAGASAGNASIAGASSNPAAMVGASSSPAARMAAQLGASVGNQGPAVGPDAAAPGGEKGQLTAGSSAAKEAAEATKDQFKKGLKELADQQERQSNTAGKLTS